MSRWEWVRTALAVEQAGSITAGAQARHISQPAASQQIQALERTLGLDLFERHRSGVRATPDGARFLAQISAPFEQIEWLLDGLDGGSVDMPDLPVVVGCQPAWFEKRFLADYQLPIPIRARFGADVDTLSDLKSGRVDIAITRLLPPAGQATSQVISENPLMLVAAPSLVPTAGPSGQAELADWIRSTPWVGFSEELPSTRRFWSKVTGSIQPTSVTLVAPDLRVVIRAVEQGMGASLLPSYLCLDALADGRLVEVFDVADLVPQEPWTLSTKERQQRPDVLAVVGAITNR